MLKPTIPDTVPNERPRQSELAPVEPPRLLWPSIMYTNAGVSSKDAPRFPTEQDVRNRYRESERGNAMRLVAFETAVIEARQRLLVLDPHFDRVGVRALQGALEYSQADEIRFLTGQTADMTTWRRELELQINQNRTDHRVVQWRKLRRKSFPFLHDRFAVVDDALWHFGATIGGGHSGVNAASGPWPAADARAVDFFAECWRVCDE